MRGAAPRWSKASAPASSAGQVVKRAVGRRVRLDGYSFDSFGEARRYEALKLRLIAGEIEWLKVHPRYPLVVNGIELGTYVADFEYRDRTLKLDARGEYPLVIEDYKEWTVSSKWKVIDGKPRIVKSKNPDWRLAEFKIKLLEALTGARVVIVNARSG